tara:strand:- start:657 stop:1412 length:756 start_codon:yes stop_codon:yes gene_type:complete
MTKLVIITGSSGGIGKELVNCYLESDFYVIGLDLISSDLGDRKNFHELNCNLLKFVKEQDYRERLSKEIKGLMPKNISEFNIINNAAVQIISDFFKLSSLDWDNTFTINAFAPFFMVKEFQDELIQCSGHVINISSIHSKLTKKGFSCYAASKAALESLTRSLAIELSPNGVSINSVSPAAISTEMLRKSFASNPEKFSDLKSYHPSKDIGDPKELAAFVKMITDHKGKFLTGSRFSIAGGIEGALHDPDY